MFSWLTRFIRGRFNQAKHRYTAKVKYKFAFSSSVTAECPEDAIAKAIEAAKECAEYMIRNAMELEQMTEDIDYEIEYLRRHENGDVVEVDHEAIWSELYPPWDEQD